MLVGYRLCYSYFVPAIAVVAGVGGVVVVVLVQENPATSEQVHVPQLVLKGPQ